MPSGCPGSDTRKLTASLHPCPGYGYEVEMFSDEMRRRCPQCKTMVFREAVPVCASYCAAAKECLGPEQWPQFLEHAGDDIPAALRSDGRPGPERE